MNITVTKKQNIRVDGVKYVAKPAGSCTGCVLDQEDIPVCSGIPCNSYERAGRQSVIFVRKEKQA